MKRIFLAILILFCVQQAKAQIIWERIEAETVTLGSGYHKAMLKDSLIFFYGSGIMSITEFKPFYSCYNLNGKLKWKNYGPKLKYNSNRYGDLIIDSDFKLVTTSFNENTRFFDFYKIGMLLGDTLTSNRLSLSNSIQQVGRRIMLKSTDGGYAIAGSGNNTSIPSLTKVDSSGNIIWSKNNYFKSITEPRSLVVKPNGNYVLEARKSLAINPSHAVHPILIEFDPNGDTIRSKIIILEDSTFYERNWYNSLIQTRSGDFLFAGGIDTVVYNWLGNTEKTYVAKVDGNFNLKWKYINKGFLRDFTIHRIVELADSSFALLAGGYNSSSLSSFAVIKISKTGQYLSHVLYSNSICNGLYRAGDWQILPDGTAVFAGFCKNGFNYVARIAGVGVPAVLGNAEELKPTTISGIEASPNPANESITFSYNLLPKTKQAEIRIYEIATGKTVQQIQIKTSGKEIQVTTEKLKSGMYAYSLLADGIPTVTKKLIVVK